MELRDIRYFAVVAENQNIGRAAETLGLSATAFSKSLRRLEIVRGRKARQARAERDSPYRRRRRAVRPNRAVAGDAERREARSDGPGRGPRRACARGRRHRRHRNVSSRTRAYPCPGKLRGITLKVSILHEDALMEALLKGEIDFFVVGTRTRFAAHRPGTPVPTISTSSLRPPPTGSPGASRSRLRIFPASAGLLWIRLRVHSGSSCSGHWQSKGLPLPCITLETNSLALRIRAIAYSNYLGISSRQFLRQEGRKFRLVELPVKEVTHRPPHVDHLSQGRLSLSRRPAPDRNPEGPGEAKRGQWKFGQTQFTVIDHAENCSLRWAGHLRQGSIRYARLMSGKHVIARWHVAAGDWDRQKAHAEAQLRGRVLIREAEKQTKRQPANWSDIAGEHPEWEMGAGRRRRGKSTKPHAVNAPALPPA